MDKHFRQVQRSEKENQPKLVNKKTDFLSSLNNIKLPSFPLNASNCYKDNQFISVPVIESLHSTCEDKIESYRKEWDIKTETLSKVKNLDMTLTEEYCLEYGDGIGKKKVEPKRQFLSNHKIDGVLRARMLDWMVEVMYSYNFQNKTYFTGVEVMDSFFSLCKDSIIPTQLHIIGIQSMFIATKMEEVYPLKMKTVYDKIGHKKISIPELLEMEHKILESLNFNMLSPSFYDICISKISNQLSLLSLFSESFMKELEELVACMGKFMCYSYELVANFDVNILGLTLANCILDFYKIERVGRLSVEEIECKQFIMESVSGFKRKYKGLGNLAKFTEKKVMEIVEGIAL